MVTTVDEHNETRIEVDVYTLSILKFFKDKRGVSVEDAVSSLSSSLEIRTHEIVRRIYLLKETGQINLYDPSPPRRISSYFFSSYSIWFWILTSLVIITDILVYVASAPPMVYFRYIFGSLFMLYLPGSSFIELLYSNNHDLPQLERITLSIGLSLALVLLVGLALNYTPWGIRLVPIILSLSLLTIIIGLGALARKYNSNQLNLERHMKSL